MARADQGARGDGRQRRMWQRQSVGANIDGSLSEGTTPTGGMVMWLTATAPDGWLICNGDTISDTDDGGTHTGPKYEGLFEILKDVEPNAGTEVWGTDTVSIPDMRRRVPMGSGGTIVSGSGDGGVDSGLGDTGGEEEHQLSIFDMPAHTHTYTLPAVRNFTTGAVAGRHGTAGTFPPPETGSKGNNGSHNTIQPSLIVNFLVKY